MQYSLMLKEIFYEIEIKKSFFKPDRIVNRNIYSEKPIRPEAPSL